MNENHFKFTPKVWLVPFFFVLSLWTVFWAERRFGVDLGIYGIYPRDFVGLRGIFLSPFLHGNIEHLYNNSLPLFILLAALYYFYSEISSKVFFFGVLFSGLITWLIGRENYHIGASGLIYVLVSFIFFKGIITKYYRLVALSLMVIFIYGGMAWYIFPHVDEAISWEGHLAGLLTGLAFAFYFKTPEYRKMIRYDWEKPDYDASGDKFMQRFDENGNFVNPPAPEDNEDDSDEPMIRYHFVPNKTQE